MKQGNARRKAVADEEADENEGRDVPRMGRRAMRAATMRKAASRPCGRFRSACAVARRAVPAVEVLEQHIDDVDHALRVELASTSSEPRDRRPASRAGRRSSA
ncbi:hypothetical protein WL86_21825 [Burkholderia diffusa]|nr:hypothetical protein WL86_21825 [Burkholderia diffusa]